MAGFDEILLGALKEQAVSKLLVISTESSWKRRKVPEGWWNKNPEITNTKKGRKVG